MDDLKREADESLEDTVSVADKLSSTRLTLGVQGKDQNVGWH